MFSSEHTPTLLSMKGFIVATGLLAVCTAFIHSPGAQLRRLHTLQEGKFYGKSKPWKSEGSPKMETSAVQEPAHVSANYIGTPASPEEETELEPGVISVSPKGSARIVKIEASTGDENDPIAKLMSRGSRWRRICPWRCNQVGHALSARTGWHWVLQ